jgi:hypothetical protein
MVEIPHLFLVIGVHVALGMGLGLALFSQTGFRHGSGTRSVIPTVPPVHRFGWLRTRPQRANPSAQPSITQHQATQLPRGCGGQASVPHGAGVQRAGLAPALWCRSPYLHSNRQKSDK